MDRLKKIFRKGWLLTQKKLTKFNKNFIYINNELKLLFIIVPKYCFVKNTPCGVLFTNKIF